MTAVDPWLDPAALVHAGRHELGCDRCGAHVLVSKNSPLQTCVQWTDQAERRCAEFAAARAMGRPPALVAGCRSLRDSVERAVHEGRLIVREAVREAVREVVREQEWS